MSSEIVFIETYSCPHCRAELEARFNDWQGWHAVPDLRAAVAAAGANRSAVPTIRWPARKSPTTFW